MGADISSPEKQPSTKQSDDDDPIYVSSTAKSTQVIISSKSQLNLNLQKDLKPNNKHTSPQKESNDFTSNTGNTMTNYLNEENLKHLQRISECVKIDFNPFIKQMIAEEKFENDQVPVSIDLFKKKPYLNIEALQQTRSQHILKNKLSDKFNRRDVQFYDMYIKKENGEDLGLLKDNQYPLEIDAEQYYQEMEVNDFNHLFANHQLIQDKFGKTIKVEIIQKESNKLQRRVREYPELIKITESGRRTSGESSGQQAKPKIDQKDPELLSIHAALKQFEREYGKTHEEIADIFCKVSGQLNKMKDYLENRPVIEWSFLEDLALTKPDESPEFQVLLQTKGWEEILIRREFLQATPVISDEEDKQ